MPKITAGGGATNVRTELDPAVPSSAPVPGVDDGPTVELTRDEDPHAPAKRPGEHVAFFAEGEPTREPERVEQEADAEAGERDEETPDGSEESAGTSDGVEDPVAPTRPVERGGRKSS